MPRFSTALLINLCLPLVLSGHCMALEITQIAPINFGTVPALNGTCELRKNGNLTGICSGSGILARFRLDGTRRQAVTVSVGQGQTSGTGVTFEPILVGPINSLNNQGVAEFDVRGRLSFNQPSTGDHNLSFLVTIIYE